MHAYYLKNTINVIFMDPRFRENDGTVVIPV